MIDLHCHILPGLDDGASSFEESLAMVKSAQDEGITAIVATPHLFRGNFSTDDFALIKERRRELDEALARSDIAVEVESGAEVYVSHSLIDNIRRNRNDLVIGGSSYMFIEFPSGHIYPGVKNLVFDLMSEGIIPIIAHPERNSVFARHPGLVYDLVQTGALTQANSGSLTGFYGRGVNTTVTRFLEWKLIHFLGSDAHNSTTLPPRLEEAVKIAEALMGKEEARSLVLDNPRAVLADRNVPFLPCPVNPRKSRKSLSFRMPGFLRRGRQNNL